MKLRIKRKRQSLGVVLGQVLAGILFTALPSVAQEQLLAPASLNDKSEAADKSSADPNVKIAASSTSASSAGTSNDRLFYTLPNFLTLEKSGQLPPRMTTGEKFRTVARGAFDYSEFPWAATLAGISQAENSEPGYGQGMSGYSKRVGAAFADNTIENFMVGAVFPSVLKEDPRYYRMGTGRFWRRSEYAASHVFVTRTDSGRKQLNFSEILGSAVAATICTYSYHPRADRNLPGVASVWERQIAFFTLTTFVKEYWPDVRRKLSHKRYNEPLQ
jgi:hypothetical protein